MAFWVIGGADLLSQGTEPDADNIIERLNSASRAEKGCDKLEYGIDGCEFSCKLSCGGNEFIFSFEIGRLGRVYLAKADDGDTFETLFFECKDGANCISCDAEAIPPSPVFPVKLQEDVDPKLGEDAVKLFNSLIERCQ